ncbi:MAG: hypothetical protein QM831_40040 [Kofleriaceae bacterium]
MRIAGLLLLTVACGGKTEAPAPAPTPPPKVVVAPADAAVDAAGRDTYDDLGKALLAIIPPDARVIGFGELHQQAGTKTRSTLSHFTQEALPVLADKVSDLVMETWLIDKGCGKTATAATSKIESSVNRPVEVHNDIGDLATAARAAKIQPHAMRVTCDDYARIAPPGKPVDTVAMLDLETRELGRIAGEAVVHRDREPDHRPWIALYGGALHNDRFPADGTQQWSYAAGVDTVTKDHYVEIDIIVPELAAGDAVLAKQPWAPLAANPTDKIQVWKRGDRSFVLILPKDVAK